MKKNMFFKLNLYILILFLSSLAYAEYPQWSKEMKVWPFDILYPFQTAFATKNGETATSDAEIQARLDDAVAHDANTVIFYIDEEQSYETFVDESGFSQTLSRIQYLVEQGHNRNLKIVCYVNGLEVIAVGAKDDPQMPTLARNYPDWLQVDVYGDTMSWLTTGQTSWVPPNSEDSWASPLRPWSDFFKSRITSLAETGLDGIYMDATFLPGMEDFGVKWASTDSSFDAAFQDNYGLPSPTEVNWDSENWRKWIYFRHQVIRDYLSAMADTARALGMVPFFESSSCDLPSGTHLANDVAFTVSGGLACSPEIEPEGNYKAAFRMSKYTRDANQDFPIWFLGWPVNAEAARREYSITLCHSGNYYPTSDATAYYPAHSFSFMDQIREPILNKRIPTQHTALIYPMRSKDYTYESESTFSAYVGAFTTLAQDHVDFRILPLETMSASDLTNIATVVLAGAESISDEEYDLIKDKTVALVGTNGTQDEWGNTRSEPLQFPQTTDIADIAPDLPFSIQAPADTYIEYYRDRADSNHFFIFAYNDKISGDIIFTDSQTMTGKVYEIDNDAYDISGTSITVPIVDYLEVIELNTSATSVLERREKLPGSHLVLNAYPNPFNAQTVFKMNIPVGGTVSLKLYNLAGQEICAIFKSRIHAGKYEIRFDAQNLASGVYVAVLKTEKTFVTKRIVLIK